MPKNQSKLLLALKVATLFMIVTAHGETARPAEDKQALHRPFARRAPTFYIAARVDFGGDPTNVVVRGATNLPANSVLTIKLYDFIGQGSQQLNVDVSVTVPPDGFFKTSVSAAAGQRFRRNMVCDILFTPAFPRQDPSVLAVVGRKGENLGFPKNPQADWHSGEYYLREILHVP